MPTPAACCAKSSHSLLFRSDSSARFSFVMSAMLITAPLMRPCTMRGSTEHRTGTGVPSRFWKTSSSNPEEVPFSSAFWIRHFSLGQFHPARLAL